jgi:TRAP-type C4-dicarboxylate transport system substrate-binding protein
VGDLKQLVGLATRPELGDEQGGISLDVLKLYPWIYESDYYNELLEKAKLDDPTPLVTSGQKFNIQWVPITRAIQRSKLMEDFFIPNVLKRTEGQVEITITSFPELGITGTDSLPLVKDGTIGFIEIYGGYVAGDFPFFDMMFLWGLYIEDKDQFLAVTATQADVDRVLSEQTGGGKVVLHGWGGEGPLSYFTKKAIRTVEDFKGQKLRTHSTGLADWVIGMGAEAQFVAFAEVYTALERGILDAGVTGAHAGHGQRWYEVTNNLIGPAISLPMGFETMNKDTWSKIPADLQAIIIEEGAKMELENLRLAAVWNETGVKVNVDKGMTFIEWPDDMKEHIHQNVALGRVLPNWIKRIGPDEVAIWNDVVAPWAKVRINPDNSIEEVP